MILDCCTGHTCDECRTCQRGTCCRRDDPGRPYPRLGDWQGRVYGSIGALATDGDKIECHACGEWHRCLSAHIVHVHDLYAFEYKAIFGLRQNSGLVSEATHARMSQARVRLSPRRSEEIQAKAKAAQAAARTPEQHGRRVADGRRKEDERRIALGLPPLASDDLLAPCPACGRPFRRKNTVNAPRVCSEACRRIRQKQGAHRARARQWGSRVRLLPGQLKAMRQASDRSAQAVAAKLGITSSTYSRWEQGVHSIPASAWTALQAILTPDAAAE